MSPRVFVGWLIAAVIAVSLAVVAVAGAPALTTAVVDRDPVFPELRARPEAVVRIVVSSRMGDFTVARGDDGRWTASDKYDYPVDQDEVRKLIVGLSDMRYVEAKTRREDRLDRLDLGDPKAEGSDARLVRLEDAAGQVLAEIIIGKERRRYTGGRDAGTYIRHSGETQAWLASGGLFVKRRLDDWLDKSLVNIANDSIRRVDIRPASGTAYIATRAVKGADFTLDPMPEGRALKADTVKRLGAGLSFVEMKDVRRRGEIALPEKHTVAVLTTFDGIEVRIDVAKMDKTYWATFDARYVGDATDQSDAAKAARAQAKTLAARLDGWVYEVAQYIHDRLAVPYNDLFAPEAS